jgi:transposase
MGKEAKAEKKVREIHRCTRRKFSAEEKIRIVVDGLPMTEKGDGIPVVP